MAKVLDYRNEVLSLKNKLFRWTLRFIPNREEAEDIVADVLLKGWEQQEKLCKLDSIEAYLMKACRNLALNRLQLKAQQNLSIEECSTAYNQATDEASPHELLEQADQRNRLNHFIQQLPDKQQLALHLREVEGLSYAELAQLMNESEANAKILVFRARQTLKEAFLKIENHELSIH